MKGKQEQPQPDDWLSTVKRSEFYSWDEYAPDKFRVAIQAWVSDHDAQDWGGGTDQRQETTRKNDEAGGSGAHL